MNTQLQRLAEDLEFIMQILTDPEFTDEDREFYLGTRQAQRQIDEGKGITSSEEEFWKRWRNT